MSVKKYSIEEIKEIVESEGLVYAVQHYISNPDTTIEDSQLANSHFTSCPSYVIIGLMGRSN